MRDPLQIPNCKGFSVNLPSLSTYVFTPKSNAPRFTSTCPTASRSCGSCCTTPGFVGRSDHCRQAVTACSSPATAIELLPIAFGLVAAQEFHCSLGRDKDEALWWVVGEHRTDRRFGADGSPVLISQAYARKTTRSLSLHSSAEQMSQAEDHVHDA